MFTINSLLFVLVPVICGLIVFYTINHRDRLKMAAGFTFAAIVFSSISLAVGAGVAVADIEILNGQIVSKQRKHDTYLESYSCNCRTVTTGSGKNKTTRTECDTCHRTHYTVTWSCDSTVGSFRIEHKDSTSDWVYQSADPQRWKDINKGDPASVTHYYTNYVKAVPETLFNPASTDIRKKYEKSIPQYPDAIYDFYKIDRFIPVGVSVPDSKEWNHDISMMLRTLGPAKQVNVIVVMVATEDSNYEYALMDAWRGAKKNDVVLLIGSRNYPKIDFVRVLTWSKSEAFKIQLRDDVQELETVDRSKIISLLTTHIQTSFERRKMKDFEYLKWEIDPPVWVYILTFVLIVIAAGGMIYTVNNRRW